MAKKIKQHIKKPKTASFSFKKVFWSFVAILLLAGGWWLYKYIDYRQSENARYVAFGISMPSNYSIHGLDVSYYQETIAWPKVKNMKVGNVAIGFVFIKATEGVDRIDKNFQKNYTNARKAGMITGAYHFFIASKDGKLQAKNFIKQVIYQQKDLPPVVDVEQLYGTPPSMMRKRLKEYLNEVSKTYATTPIIYTNVDFYNQYLGDDFSKYPLWVAHYHNPDKPNIGRPWLFWQHSEEGRVNGIKSKVDCNVFYGDSSAFYKILKK